MLLTVRPPLMTDRLRRGPAVLGLLSVGAAATAIFFFDPAESAYPGCVFHVLTGLHCPGCGATRALHQLLHGHVGTAAHLNLLFVLCLPLAAMWAARYAMRWLRGEPVRAEISLRTLSFLVAVSAVFGVIRNLPGFEWLAP